MKRICGMVFALLLILSAAMAVPVAAAEDETIILAGSDFQVSGNNTSRIEQVLGTLEIHGITKADAAFFCGDYTLYSEEDNQGQSSAGLAVLKKLFTPIVGSKMTFVQGNHDPADTAGLSKSGNNDPYSGKYGVYVIHEDEYLQYDWAYSREVVEKTAASLKEYLDEKANSGWTKPIFVLSHVGLHWGNRTILQGSAVHGNLLVDVLNEAGEKGLNVIFLYGHDHSGGYADFIGGSAVYFKKGDQIEVCTGKKKEHETRTLKFTYMNAGYIGYYTTNSDEPTGCDTAVTMSVFRIRGDEVIITRYDGDINLLTEHYGIHNLKSKGVYSDYFYKEYGYHVDLDTREYTSSRKVTATDDVPVETPMPGQMTEPTTTTTEWTTVGSGLAVSKTQSTTVATQTTISSTIAQTTESTTTVSSTTVPSDTTSTETTTASTEVETTTAPATTQPTAPTEAETETSTETASTSWILTPGGIALLVTGGVLVVAVPVGVVAFLMLRKKKKQ